MKRQAFIVGAGVAGLSCAALLARRGWDVEVCQLAARPAPDVVLNDVTCDLLRTIWPGRRDLLDGGHALERRNVSWGPAAEVSSVAQASIVISGRLLLDRLAERLADTYPSQVRITSWAGRADADVLQDALREQAWIVDASGRASEATMLLGAARRLAPGSRRALATEVTLVPGSDERACWIETVPDGWLFLAPRGDGRAILQGMLPATADEPAAPLTRLVGQGRAIQAQIGGMSGAVTRFEATPGMLEPPCQPGWLAVGDAAVALDPIGGDGTGHAVRGAILAAGVLHGIGNGLPLADGLDHYTARLQRTYAAHLQACLAYYASGGFSAAWTPEIAHLTRALALEADRAARTAPFTYRLDGLDLVPFAPRAGRATARPSRRSPRRATTARATVG